MAGVLTLVGGCYAEVSSSEEVAQATAAVQTDYVTIRTKRYAEPVSGDAVNATASVHVPWPNYTAPDGTGVGATCGATFISPHYAVTAAHCVNRYGAEYDDQQDPVIQPMSDLIELRQYDTTNLNWTRALEAGVVSGSWPNWTRGTTLTANDGYYVRHNTNCMVKLRCGRPFSPTPNCPEDITGDIALVYCPSRPDDAPYVVVSNGETIGEQVETLWFHEMLDLPTSGTGERFINYGGRTEAGNYNRWENNYHYRTHHQLLPFRSRTWANGTPYTSLEQRGDVTWTDVFGCHGTSGSGMFRAGTTALLGPVANAGNAFTTGYPDLLCANMDHASVVPGTAVLSYTSRHITAAIEAINIEGEGTIVLNDR